MIKNLNVLITGTSSGIGLQLAKQFLKYGNKVWGCSRRSKRINNKNYFHSKLDLSNKKNYKFGYPKFKNNLITKLIYLYQTLHILIENYIP